MGKYKKNKKLTRRMLIYWILLLILIGGIIITFPNYFLKIVAKYEEKDFLQQEITDLADEQAELEKEVVQLGDSNYVAKIARQKYLFSKNGEMIIKIVDDEKEKNVETETTNNNERFIAIFIATVILYLIISKTIKARSK